MTDKKAGKRKSDPDKDHEIIARASKAAGEVSVSKAVKLVEQASEKSDFAVLADAILNVPVRNPLDDPSYRYHERMQRLLWVVLSYAPDEKWRAWVAEEYDEHVLEMMQESEDRALLWLVELLVDGLKYGNWPWVLADKVRASQL